ncbi:multiple epidermal growth factor-like domains protein 10 [Crassostrea angulata]|uniref:multiple epidermal growth factor-like domains protein 10 n=1 Tax=Magallana angulata TaxID=2784310 RepID=UPI0022B0DB1E|nr:multiple epidermal growth factor-like domains protein 10 [Crassostrea angulata]
MLSFAGLKNFVISLLIIKMSINLVNCVGNCTKSDGKTGCCNNYHRSNGICVKCPKGTYGENCSEICPVNLYGELCLERCDCKPNEDCNRVHGCLPNRGICGLDREKKCCRNYYNLNGRCTACPLGTYGNNCVLVCPDGTYGLFCSGKCHCATSDCDKDSGCPERESYIETIGLVYWIIPLILGTVIFSIACLYCRLRKRKIKKSAAECIPRNQLEMQCTANDEFLHNDNNTVNGNKMVAASFDTCRREKRLSDAEDGAYNTLDLRVFDYEVPIKHEARKKSYSETSSLYIKCPNGKRSPSSDDKNCALVPSIRFTRNTDESMQRKIEMHPTMQQIDVKNELCEENLECSSKAFDNVYDKATFEDTKKEPPRQIFLKELSSHLLNNDHMT